MLKRVMSLGLVAVLGCTDGPNDPIPSETELSAHRGGAGAMPFEAVGDCTLLTIIDAGTVTVEGGVRKERGFEAECPFLGDVSGVIRFTRSSTLRNGDGPFTEWDGPAWGRTVITVHELFGEPVANGTFRGPYSTDWQTLITGGEFKNVRVGTDDLRGLIMQATASGENFGQFISEEGVIFGRQRD